MKNPANRFWRVLLALCMLLSLTACGKTGDTPSDAGPAETADDVSTEGPAEETDEVPDPSAPPDESGARLLSHYYYTDGDGVLRTHFVCVYISPDDRTNVYVRHGAGETQGHYSNRAPWRIATFDMEGEYGPDEVRLCVKDYDQQIVAEFDDWSDVVPENEYDRYEICPVAGGYALFYGRAPDRTGSGCELSIAITNMYLKDHEPLEESGILSDSIAVYTGDGAPMQEFLGGGEVTVSTKRESNPVADQWRITLSYSAEGTGKTVDEMMAALEDAGAYYVYTDPNGTAHTIQGTF